MIHVSRLVPGQDLREEIERLVALHGIAAGVVLSGVGSLSRLCVRVADGKTTKTWDESLEIVSLTGTLSPDGCHLHLCASNQDGQVVGGHLKIGSIVHTTVELIMTTIDGTRFTRTLDEATGYDELVPAPVLN